MHFLKKLYVSHGSATTFLRDGEKYYIYFVDSLLLSRTVKELSKSVNIWRSYCKNSTSRFLTQYKLRNSIELRGKMTLLLMLFKVIQGHRFWTLLPIESPYATSYLW